MTEAAGQRAPVPARTAASVLRPLGALAVLAALAALPPALRAIGSSGLLALATSVLVYAIAAASLNLALGYAGLVSFGHAAFLGTGAYVVGILNAQFVAGEPFLGFVPGTNQLLLTLPAAALVCAAIALPFGALSLRTSGVQFIMITLAFAQMLFFLFVSLKAYGGDDGLSMRRRNVLPISDLRDDTSFYYACLVVAVVVVLALRMIVRSRFGFALGAVRQNERRAAALGLAPYPHRLAAFVLSATGTGIAGALLANHQRFVAPDLLHWTKSGELMVMVIFGGIGTLAGPLVGAAAYVLLESGLAAWTENWQIVLGPLLVAVVICTRGGLVALARWNGRRQP